MREACLKVVFGKEVPFVSFCNAVWEDQDEDGETKNTLSFKGTGLKT
jgi:hypothetical protein